MEKYNKVWGDTAPIFHKNNVESHLINVNPFSFCSKHCHNHKYNMFLVVDGELWVSVWKSYGLVDVTHLKPGESMKVAPGEFHQFESKSSSCKALEFYWTEISPEDIQRENTGGLTNTKDVV